MKKMLSVILVLTMAGIANASLSWAITGNTDPGGTVTIKLNTTDNSTAACLAWIDDNGAGGHATPGSWNTRYTTNDPGYNGGTYGFGSGSLILATGAYDAPNYATGVLYTYTYTLPSG